MSALRSSCGGADCSSDDGKCSSNGFPWLNGTIGGRRLGDSRGCCPWNCDSVHVWLVCGENLKYLSADCSRTASCFRSSRCRTCRFL